MKVLLPITYINGQFKYKPNKFVSLPPTKKNPGSPLNTFIEFWGKCDIRGLFESEKDFILES